MTHVIKAQTAGAMLFLASCTPSIGQRELPRQVINIEDIDISSEAVRSLENRAITIRSRVERTEYNSLALYPRPRSIDGSSSGLCIDLVLSPALKQQVSALEGRTASFEGHFVLVNRLPDYTASLVIEGTRHSPVCQIFSATEPYPYFVVTSVE